MSSSGDSIAVGAGLVRFLSHDGDLLASLPFGNNVVMTPDGSAIVSSYGSSMYFFRQNLTDNASQISEIWDTQMSAPVSSISITKSGNMLVFSSGGSGYLNIFSSDGHCLGVNNKSYYSVVHVSSDGRVIVGLSQAGVTIFDRNGHSRKTFNLSIVSEPTNMVLTSDGKTVFFNDAQRVWSASTVTGDGIWSSLASGDINSMAASPSGSDVVVGTANGYVDHFDAKGNLTWEYNTKENDSQGSMVQCVDLSNNGGFIGVGTFDGKTLLLSSEGNLIWSNQTNDHIRHIAVNNDGSFIVASGDSTIYAYNSNNDIVQNPSLPGPVLTALPPEESENTGYPFNPAAASTSSPTDFSQHSTVETVQGTPLSPATVWIALGVIVFVFCRNYEKSR